MAEIQRKVKAKGKKLRRCGKDRKKRDRYIAENRRLNNRAARIYRRIRTYKVPENQLNGLSGTLRDKVAALLR